MISSAESNKQMEHGMLIFSKPPQCFPYYYDKEKKQWDRHTSLCNYEVVHRLEKFSQLWAKANAPDNIWNRKRDCCGFRLVRDSRLGYGTHSDYMRPVGDGYFNKKRKSPYLDICDHKNDCCDPTAELSYLVIKMLNTDGVVGFEPNGPNPKYPFTIKRWNDPRGNDFALNIKDMRSLSKRLRYKKPTEEWITKANEFLANFLRYSKRMPEIYMDKERGFVEASEVIKLYGWGQYFNTCHPNKCFDVFPFLQTLMEAQDYRAFVLINPVQDFVFYKKREHMSYGEKELLSLNDLTTFNLVDEWFSDHELFSYTTPRAFFNLKCKHEEEKDPEATHYMDNAEREKVKKRKREYYNHLKEQHELEQQANEKEEEME